MYRVELSRQAQEFYRKSERPLASKLARCFEQLEQNPREHANIKLLKGNLAGRYRYRVANYRVIYRIENQSVKVLVLKIAHRSDVYE